MSYDESVLEMSYLYPTSQTWSLNDDREILCIVADPEGASTGSLPGAAR